LHQDEEITARILINNNRNSSPYQYQSSSSNFPIRNPSTSSSLSHSLSPQLPLYPKEEGIRMRFPFHEESKPQNQNPLFSMQINGSRRTRKLFPSTQNSNGNSRYDVGTGAGLHTSQFHRQTAAIAAAAAVASTFPYPYDQPAHFQHVHNHNHHKFPKFIKNENLYLPHKPQQYKKPLPYFESNAHRFQNFKDYEDLPHPRPTVGPPKSLLPNEFKRGHGALTKLSLFSGPSPDKTFLLPTYGYLIYNTAKGPPFYIIPAPKHDVENFHAQYFNHYDHRIGKKLQN